jgi:hypothetical protein
MRGWCAACTSCLSSKASARHRTLAFFRGPDGGWLKSSRSINRPQNDVDVVREVHIARREVKKRVNSFIARYNSRNWRLPLSLRGKRSGLTDQQSLSDCVTTPSPNLRRPMTIHSRQIVGISYTNHRGETAFRRIIPIKIYFGSSQWHPKDQWLMDAFDLDKQAQRSFAMIDIHKWGEDNPQVSQEVS